MLTLWLGIHEVGLTDKGCEAILSTLDMGKTHVYYQRLDDSKVKQKKGYAKPAYKFVFKGKTWQVPQKRFAELKNACELALFDKQDVVFQIGLKPISGSFVTVSRTSL